MDKSTSKTRWREKVVLEWKNSWGLMSGFTFTLLCLTLWQTLGDSFSRGPTTTNHSYLPDSAHDDQPERCLWIKRPSLHSLLLQRCGCSILECHSAAELPDDLWTLKISTSPPPPHCSICTFGVVCCKSFALPASPLALPSSHFQITAQKSSTIDGTNTSWATVVAQLSASIPQYPKAGRESAESLWSSEWVRVFHLQSICGCSWLDLQSSRSRCEWLRRFSALWGTLWVTNETGRVGQHKCLPWHSQALIDLHWKIGVSVKWCFAKKCLVFS